MELRIFTEPQQGASYDDLLRVARCAEDAGYGAFFRSDHMLRMGGGDGRPGPTDSWVTLGALARETTHIRLGTLMTAVTFRHPGPLAIAVAQVDQMSGGRVEFGFGAGWYEAEHAAYAVPFPDVAERFDRFAEQLEIITGLWDTPDGGMYSFTGTYYQVANSPGLPKPVQRPHPPVIIGGMGRRRTPALTARFADEFNVGFNGMDATAEQFGRVTAACRAAGRDPGDLVLSVAQVVCVGATEADVSRRAEAIGRQPQDLRDNGIAGTPAEVVDRIGQWVEQTGTQRIYLQVLDLSDLDHIELIASQIVPQLG